MTQPERDEYQVGSLVNGLPTCTFRPKTYHRIVTNIVLGNSISSTVSCYRGLIAQPPIAQNVIGTVNTLRGRIAIPAGQPFFVQWSAVGANASDAFARVSWDRVDNPLEGSSNGGLGNTGQEWDVTPDVGANSTQQITIAGLYTTNSPTFITFFGGSTAVQFRKQLATSALLIHFHTTAYATPAGTAGIAFGVNVEGVNYEIAKLAEANTLLNAHTQFSGVRKILVVSAGLITVQPVWRRITGGANAAFDQDDLMSIAVSEVERFSN